MWIAAIVIVALLAGWGWYSAGLVLSLPREALSSNPGGVGLRFDNVSFSSADGTLLKGWFVPSPKGSDAVLVICHGRGACRSDMLARTQHLASRGGFNLLYFDFRNHGESGGSATSLGRMESWDLEAALGWLKAERPVCSRRVGLYGMSMGGAVAILTAARRPEFAAVAVESAFTSAHRSIIRYARLFHHVSSWAVPYTLWWTRLRLGFDPDETSPVREVGKISPRPLFLLQGGADVRMPPSEGEALFAAAGEPKELWTVPGADHGGLWETAGREYEDRLSAFFKQSLGPA